MTSHSHPVTIPRVEHHRPPSPQLSLPRNANPLWAPPKPRSAVTSPRLHGAQSAKDIFAQGGQASLVDKTNDLISGDAASFDTDDTLAASCCCIFDGVSSRAACNLEDCFLLGEGMAKVAANPFDRETGKGIVNVGSAENRLMTDVLLAKLNAEPINWTAQMLGYGTYHGSNRLRDTVAAFMNRNFKSADPLAGHNLAVFAGCASTLSALFQVLCDPGDGVLLPAPYFGGFAPHLKLASRAQPVPVMMARPDFKLSIPRLEKALDKEEAAGRPVRALLLCHPHNPLAYALTKQELIDAMAFAHRRNLHLVVDEIYGLSMFDGDFVSSLSILASEVPGGFNPNRLHVVWGLSKDFCANGLRLGVVASRAPKVLSALHRIAFFHNINTPTDALVTKLLADTEWTDAFVARNKQRLREMYAHLTTWLDERGIPYLPAQAGFYIFLDLSRWVRKLGFNPPDYESDSEEEPACDRMPERSLWYKMLDAGVYAAPGEGFGVPDALLGYFRLVFAVEDEKVLDVALERIGTVLDEIDRL